MKRYIAGISIALLSLLKLTVICNAGRIPYDPNTMSYPVSVEQAMASVRAWAGDPGLQLELEGIAFSWTISNYPHRYEFLAANGSHFYNVDCFTGQVTAWQDRSAAIAHQQRDMYSEDPKLPSAELSLAVLQYLQAKYPGFGDKNMQTFTVDGKAVMYHEVLPGDVTYPGNRAGCNIDDWTGQIYGYWASHNAPPAISIVPLIDAVQAEQIAIDYVGTLEMWDWDENADAYLTNPQSAFVIENEGLVVVTDWVSQRLSWNVQVHVHACETYTVEDYAAEMESDLGLSTGEQLLVKVDAHTGEVFYCEPSGCLGASPDRLELAALAKTKKNRKPNPSALKSQPPFKKGELYLNDLRWSDLMYPPLAVGNVGYIYAKYLPILYGGTIEWDSGVVNMRVADRKVTLRPRTGTMEIDGVEIQLANPTMVIAGRAYVPHEAVEHICGAKTSWDAKEKRLSIVPGDTPLKPKFRRPEKMQ